jgi:chromosome segregation ATPase
MMSRIIFILSVAGLLASCDYKTKKEQALEAEADSLRNELAVNQQMTGILLQVGAIIDSIDASRDLVRTDLLEGNGASNYVARLADIQQYIDDSQRRMEELERSLKKSKASAGQFQATIKQLKKDLEARSAEVRELTAAVARYQDENATLTSQVALQGAELSDKMELLTARQNEVAKLQADVNQLIEQSRFDLAEAYYRQAQALEEAARRTKLAPRKKKSTQKEALELYRLALLTGKSEAKEKVEKLEKEI